MSVTSSRIWRKRVSDDGKIVGQHPQSSAMSAVQPEFSFCFHGGAGVIPQGSIDSDVYVQSLRQIVQQGYQFAETHLQDDNKTAIDVAEYVVQLLENDALFNAGRGAVFTSEGTHEMEASIMDGATLDCGAVSMIKHYKNPISIARLVMETTPHVYLMGDGAEAVAAANGMQYTDNSYFSTQKRRDQLTAAKEAQGIFNDHDAVQSRTAEVPSTVSLMSAEADTASNVADNSDTGTVGCVCFYKGSLAAATSTGGMTNKRSGRIGDTPIVGAGTYANNQTCAVSCTGKGEMFVRSVAAYDISARMQYGGLSLKQAAHDAVHCGTKSSAVAPRRSADNEPAEERLKLLPVGSGGVVCVDHSGAIVMDFNSQGMFRGWAAKFLAASSDCTAAESSTAQVGIWSELIDVPLASTAHSDEAMDKPLPALVAPRDTVLIEVAATDAESMRRIGQLRFAVWEQEQSINKDLFPDRCWVDDLDKEGRHWVLQDATTGAWMATARLTMHTHLEDSYRDVQLWKRSGRHLPLPTVDLGRLVVLNDFRGRGLAQYLNCVRMHAAKAMGAKSIMVTASEGNARLLKKLGFEDIGETAYFDDRPNTCFYALQYNF